MIKDKKHIVFLTPGFAKKEEDTHFVPAFTVYLKALFKKHSEHLKLTVLTFQFPKSNKSYIWCGISIIPLNGRDKFLKKIWVWPKAFRILNRIHKSHPITCIHSLWLGECALIGERFSIKHNIKHIITVMGQESVIKNKYSRLMKANYSQYISLSQNHAKSLKHNLKLKTRIIPWGINPSDFKELHNSSIDILGVGSLIPVKNYNLFITIISKVKVRYPNLKVIIMGFGVERDKLQELVNELELNGTIKFSGLVNREVVLDAMSRSNILLHTSTFESFGYVFTEALYSGMKLVSSNVGCAVTSENWKVCNTVTEYVEGCLYFIDNVETNKERILFYSVNETIQSYLNLYLS